MNNNSTNSNSTMSKIGIAVIIVININYKETMKHRMPKHTTRPTKSKQNNSLGTMVAAQKFFGLLGELVCLEKPTFSEELVGLGKAMNLKKRYKKE